MEITCKNCHQTYTGHYCNNCGQPANTHKINGHFLWHEIQHGLLHFDDGIPYSIKQLFTRPGHSIREFIEGKRVHHFKPLSLLVLLAALYGVLYHYFHINIFDSSPDAKLNLEDLNEWTTTHYAWVTIATIPLFTLGTFICFRKQGYNFIEYFVMNTYKASQRLCWHIITFPLIYYFNGTPKFALISAIIYAVDLFLILWTNLQFFNKISKIEAFFLSVLSYCIYILSLFSIVAFILWIAGDL